MQTKRQIQQLLASAGIRPNKRLGQHFLIDKNLMRLLLDSAEIRNDDVVLEVGCGTGSLTEALIQKAGRIIAVELDRNLADIASVQLSKATNLQLINTDILENKNRISPVVTNAIESARKEYRGRILLVANLPYNVASPMIINLIIGPITADGMYVTVQKEVASRMTATPGSRDYGILSIFLHAMGDVKLIRNLKPSVFWPKPQVDSAMVSFRHNREKSARIKDMKLFGRIVNLFMSHRRKTILTSSKLARGELAKNWSEIFKKYSVDPRKRPQQLSVEDYINLTNAL